MLEPMECAELEAVPKWMRAVLHDLCQPLMALECQLYLAQVEVEATGPRRVTSERATLESGLHECQRMIRLIRQAQLRMATADTEARESIQERTQ